MLVWDVHAGVGVTLGGARAGASFQASGRGGSAFILSTIRLLEMWQMQEVLLAHFVVFTRRHSRLWVCLKIVMTRNYRIRIHIIARGHLRQTSGDVMSSLNRRALLQTRLTLLQVSNASQRTHLGVIRWVWDLIFILHSHEHLLVWCPRSFGVPFGRGSYGHGGRNQKWRR